MGRAAMLALLVAPLAWSAAANWSLSIAFRPAASPVPPGYLVDPGAAFSAHGGFSYGWNSPNLTAYDRRSQSDALLDGLIHMQRPEDPDASWRLALPNGWYHVHVVCGDPTYANSIFRIAVQDSVVVDGIPTTGSHWCEGSVIVPVTNGSLRVTNLPGSWNNKLCSIELVSVPGADG